MKATGIVRRIDELGRVVIPKEIRKTMRIKEGDPLEIYTDREGQVILKKYSPIGEIEMYARHYAESLSESTGTIVCITDTDQVIASAGTTKKELDHRYISPELERAIAGRKPVLAVAGAKSYVEIVQDQVVDYKSQIVIPIVSDGDPLGAVVMLEKEGKKKLGLPEQRLASCASIFFAKQMER